MDREEGDKPPMPSPKSFSATELEDKRMVENDIPFDQANDVADTRALTTSTWTNTGGQIDPDSYNCRSDQQAQVIIDSVSSPVSTRFDSIWLSSPERTYSPLRQKHKSPTNEEERKYPFAKRNESDGCVRSDGRARFVLPPPKYSDPYKEKSKNQMESPSTGNDGGQNRSKEYPPHDSSLLNASYVGKVNESSYGSTFNSTGRQSTTNSEQDLDRSKSQQAQDSNSKVIHKVRRRSRQRRKEQILAESACTDDDMSTQNYGVVSATNVCSLQERSYQAWKSRQRKSSNIRSKGDSDSRPKKGANVSFGASNTIHRFETDTGDRHRYRSEDKEDNMSLDRSLNSEYTKTLESEVEDMIKDILFIGNPDKNKPGRRKYRYKPDSRRKMKREGTASARRENSARVLNKDELHGLHDTNGNSDKDNASSASESAARAEKKTRGPSNDIRFANKITPLSQSTNRQRALNVRDDKSSLASTISRGSSVDSNTLDTFLSEKDTMDDPVNAVFGLVEGGLSIMSTAIGYALENYTTNEDQESSIHERKKTHNDFDILQSCGIHIADQKNMTDVDSQVMTRVTGTEVSSKKFLSEAAGRQNPIVVDKKMERSSNAKRDPEAIASKELNKKLVTGSNNEPENRTSRTERVSELSELALYAARSVHKLQGVQYDESVAIDMYKEVKICPVTLNLPLGSK